MAQNDPATNGEFAVPREPTRALKALVAVDGLVAQDFADLSAFSPQRRLPVQPGALAATKPPRR
jgi:hypothetical protein